MLDKNTYNFLTQADIEDLENSYAAFVSIYEKYGEKNKLPQLRKAFEFAVMAHKNQRRATGKLI